MTLSVPPPASSLLVVEAVESFSVSRLSRSVVLNYLYGRL
jgi:hypothetical protein